jgi:hypothetical protein
MHLYTYEDANGVVVGELLATADHRTATDVAARNRWRLIENTFEFSDSELVADFTPEDESDAG